MIINYLIEYQKLLGLEPDGIIGAKTAAAMMKDLGITDKLYFSHYIGQLAHESGLYKNFRENLNYSEAGLLNIYRRYYTPSLAKQHARNPEKIANHVYAKRLGNGDEASGDGWFYRGAFGLQITGKTNFQEFFKYAGIPLETNPDTLKNNPRMYFLAGKFWFEKNGVDKICTAANDTCILAVTKRVNGGTNGLDDRKIQTKKMFKIMGLA